MLDALLQNLFFRSIDTGGRRRHEPWHQGSVCLVVLSYVSSGTGRTGASRSVCEAQVALIHMGGHEIGYIILIQSRF